MSSKAQVKDELGDEGRSILRNAAKEVELDIDFSGYRTKAQADEALSLMEDLAKDIEKEKQSTKMQEEDPAIPINQTAADFLADRVISPLMDYTSGAIRTGLGAAVGIPTGTFELEDLKKAAIGKAPGTREYLTRLQKKYGFGSGPSASDIPYLQKLYSDKEEKNPNDYQILERGGLLDPTVAGAATTALDMLLSPQTLSVTGRRLFGRATPEINAANRTAQELRAAEELARQKALTKPGLFDRRKAGLLDFGKRVLMGNITGKTLQNKSAEFYKNAKPFQMANQEMIKHGKLPVFGDVEKGWVGTNQDIYNRAQKEMEKAGQKIGAFETQKIMPRIMAAREEEAALKEAVDDFLKQVKAGKISQKEASKQVGDAWLDFRQRYPDYRVSQRKILEPLKTDLDRAKAEVVAGQMKVPGLSESQLPSVSNVGQEFSGRYSTMMRDMPEVEMPTAIAHKRQLDESVRHSIDAMDSAPYSEQLLTREGDAYRAAIENAADEAVTGMGGQYHLLNQDYGNYATGMRGFRRATKGSGGVTVGDIGRGVISVPLLHQMGASPWEVAAILGGAKAATTTAGRTALGVLGNRLGKLAVPDAIIRELLINSRNAAKGE